MTWFADGLVIRGEEGRFVDARYGAKPEAPDGIWGAVFHPGEDPAVTAYRAERNTDLAGFVGVIFGGFRD